MGYKAALEAAGYDVIAFENFGCYQGQWVAIVREGGGREFGAIVDWYGSCTVCDAFQAEFNDWYDDDAPDYDRRLREFGLGYTALPLAWQLDAYAKRCTPDPDDGYVSSDDEEIYTWLRNEAEKLGVATPRP